MRSGSLPSQSGQRDRSRDPANSLVYSIPTANFGRSIRAGVVTGKQGEREAPVGDRAFFPLESGLLAEATGPVLREAVAAAEIHPLLCALALLSGDESLLDPRFRPDTRLGPSGPKPCGGLPPGLVDEARQRALTCLESLRRRPDLGTRVPSPHLLERALDFTTGGAHHAARRMVMRELDVPHDGDAPRWRLGSLAPGRGFRVAVIGAGMSGILMAHRLRQAGIACVVFEKNPAVGGTWHDNAYPGCRLDTPNFAYSYSFAQNPRWPSEFSSRQAILEYFTTLARRFGVIEDLRLGTEVLRLEYREREPGWTLHARDAAGRESAHEFDAVVSAVGQLNRPSIPAFPGAASFAGPSWHTARWRHDVSLAGKRVGVIGTGASAYQVVPAILGEVRELVVFQRNPPWMLPTPRYYEPISAAHRLLLVGLPHYANWHRFYQVWASVKGRWDLVRVDPQYRHPVSVSAANEELRQALVRHIEASYAGRPDLVASQVPDYPPGAKRMLRDNGAWPAALKDPKVRLETRAIQGITPSGIRVADGAVHELDALVYATGFHAADFLVPMQVQGVGGRRLHDWWDGDARAYLGLCMPGFPNFFCMYGPNSNLSVHGSLILFAESQAHWIMEALHAVLSRGARAIDVTEEAFARFNVLMDEQNALMAWGASGVSSWYKNARGRVSQNWPLSLEDYFSMTERPQLADFRLLG
jgi:4-hydroxyacetophenone monooxygenase